MLVNAYSLDIFTILQMALIRPVWNKNPNVVSVYPWGGGQRMSLFPEPLTVKWGACCSCRNRPSAARVANVVPTIYWNLHRLELSLFSLVVCYTIAVPPVGHGNPTQRGSSTQQVPNIVQTPLPNRVFLHILFIAPLHTYTYLRFVRMESYSAAAVVDDMVLIGRWRVHEICVRLFALLCCLSLWVWRQYCTK